MKPIFNFLINLIILLSVLALGKPLAAQKIESIINFTKHDSGIDFKVKLEDGSNRNLSLDFYSPKIIRVKLQNIDSNYKPINLLNSAEAVSIDYSIKGKSNSIVVSAKKFKIVISKKTFELSFQNHNGNKLISSYSHAGIEVKGEENISKFKLDDEDSFFGFGEKYGKLNKRNSIVEIWNYDAGDSYGDSSYISIPFFVNTKGYGLFFNTTWRTVFDLGKSSDNWFSIKANGGNLDYFILLGSPKEIVSEYTFLTGRLEMVPKWALGLWNGTYTGGYKGKAGLGQNEFLNIAKKFRKKRIPCDALRIDSNWDDLEGSDYLWHRSYPEPTKMITEITKMGFKMSLHDRPIPYGVLRNHPLERGWLVPPENEYLDFTNSEAANWWWNRHEVLIDMGVDAFKPDIGEEIPTDAKFFNGKTGKEMHNIYASLYIKAHFEGYKKYTGKRAVLFCRSGYVGSQKYPLPWAGDQHRARWDILPTLIRAGQSIGLSGYGLWSHDIGGIGTQNGIIPDADLYIRWAQFGFFSPVPQTFGRPWREPWKYDTDYVGIDVLGIFREFDNLRYQLLPYNYSLMWESANTGLPLMRAMMLEFPNDEDAWKYDLQYMFGPSILVAPIVNAEGKANIYLPKGLWFDFWTDRKMEGDEEYILTYDISSMPLFVKAGAIIPMIKTMQYTGEKEIDTLRIHVYPGADGSFNLYNDDGESFNYKENKYLLIKIDYFDFADSAKIIFEPENISYQQNSPKYVSVVYHSGSVAEADASLINDETEAMKSIEIIKEKDITLLNFEYTLLKKKLKIKIDKRD